METFSKAKLQEIIAVSGVCAARAWLELYGLQSPALTALVHHSTGVHANSNSEEVEIATLVSLSPHWRTVVHVMDGELPVVALEEIDIYTVV
jgi:hypothetical protein